MANTFSQFGLNIDSLLMGNGNAEENKATDGGGTESKDTLDNAQQNMLLMAGNQKSSKLDALLGSIPDFGFLNDSSVSMGQLFV